jgi:hypothetical protein
VGLTRVTCAAAPRQLPILSGGGKNADGSPGFASHRNDFGTTPIHQLMVENNISAYFHGHDHQYVYETRDGIVYQEVSSPSMSGSGFSGIYTEGDHGDYQTIKILPNAGHLRVTVTATQATVDYVKTSGAVNSLILSRPTLITAGPTGNPLEARSPHHLPPSPRATAESTSSSSAQTTYSITNRMTVRSSSSNLSMMT